MCEYPLCLQLRDALNAAFRGQPLHTDTLVGAWAHGFMVALEKLTPVTSYPRGYVWHLAKGILESTYSNCPCDGLVEHISCDPHAFLRSVLLVARLNCSRQEGDSRPSASLH